MLTPMPYTNTELRKIADAVRKARIAQTLDKEPAARAAKVNSITWKRVEDSEAVRDASLSKILKSLNLPDADAILAGRHDVTIVAPPMPQMVVLEDVPTAELLDVLRSRIVSSDDPESRDRLAAWNARTKAVREHGRLNDTGNGH